MYLNKSLRYTISGLGSAPVNFLPLATDGVTGSIDEVVTFTNFDIDNIKLLGDESFIVDLVGKEIRETKGFQYRNQAVGDTIAVRLREPFTNPINGPIAVIPGPGIGSTIYPSVFSIVGETGVTILDGVAMPTGVEVFGEGDKHFHAPILIDGNATVVNNVVKGGGSGGGGGAPTAVTVSNFTDMPLGIEASMSELGCTTDGSGNITGKVFVCKVVDEASGTDTYVIKYVGVGSSTVVDYNSGTHGVWEICSTSDLGPNASRFTVDVGAGNSLPSAVPMGTTHLTIDYANMSGNIDVSSFMPTGLANGAHVVIRKIDNSPGAIEFTDGVSNYKFVDKNTEYISLDYVSGVLLIS